MPNSGEDTENWITYTLLRCKMVQSLWETGLFFLQI